jgi:Protein of unknown function (DUF3829)
MSRRPHALLLAAAFALGAFSCPGASGVFPRAQAQSAANLDVPSDERLLQSWVRKTNAYTELLNASLRATSSWSRYTSWVDVKSGPTGKERIVYGLYEVIPETAKRAIDAADTAAGSDPKIGSLDELARTYARTFESLVPLVNEASRYYERKDYKDDGMARGRELHGRLVAAFEPFLKQRALLEAELKSVKAVVNQRQLEAIEKREGKSYAWHVRNVMNQAGPLGDAIVQEPSPALLKSLDESIAAYAKAVRDFDEYLASPGAQKGRGTFDSAPRAFLGDVREYRDELAAKRPNAGFRLQALVQKFNAMIQAANLESRLRS